MDFDDTLAHGVADLLPQRFANGNTSLLGRCAPLHAWTARRLQEGVDSYGRITLGAGSSAATTIDRAGRPFHGVNFSSQDYLGLAAHPEIIEAVQRTARDVGVHSAGSPTLAGGSAPSRELAQRLSEFLGMASVSLFPTGWAAGYGAIRALVGEDDHVVLDVSAHACLQEGARSATRRVHLHPHLDVVSLERHLRRIRSREPAAGILVVTETLFSMDSDAPDLAHMQALCRQYDATLLVDVAHDLGAMGPGGLGIAGAQGVLAGIDVLVGSFSKSFASNGGFVAANDVALGTLLRCACGPYTFSNAISPLAAAIVLACLSIVRSTEGDALREQLACNVASLRAHLEARGFKVLGQPSPIVPVLLGDQALARVATKHALQLGGLVNLVEYPGVSRNTARWRLQVMASHQEANLLCMADIACEARALAVAQLARGTGGRADYVAGEMR